MQGWEKEKYIAFLNIKAYYLVSSSWSRAGTISSITGQGQIKIQDIAVHVLPETSSSLCCGLLDLPWGLAFWEA